MALGVILRILRAKKKKKSTGRAVVARWPAPKKKSKPKPKAIPDKKWPSISYGGMIKNCKSVKVIALVNINKKSNLMQQGETKYEIELLKIYNDSIEVKFSGVKKYIRK